VTDPNDLPDECCGKCRFWWGTNEQVDGKSIGFCRNAPPVLLDHHYVASPTSWCQPITKDRGWCGKFRDARSLEDVDGDRQRPRTLLAGLIDDLSSIAEDQ